MEQEHEVMEGVQCEWICVSPISAYRHPVQRRREGSRVVEVSQAQSSAFPVFVSRVIGNTSYGSRNGGFR